MGQRKTINWRYPDQGITGLLKELFPTGGDPVYFDRLKADMKLEPGQSPGMLSITGGSFFNGGGLSEDCWDAMDVHFTKDRNNYPKKFTFFCPADGSGPLQLKGPALMQA